MDNRTLQQIREMLQERLDETLPLAAGLRDSLEGMQQVKEAMDDLDLISNKCLCEMTSRLHGRTQQFVMEILGALKRMRFGNFGVCEECGSNIGIERLRAQPTATLCVCCRRALEGTTRMKRGKKGCLLESRPGSPFQRKSHEDQTELNENAQIQASLQKVQKLVNA